LAEPVACKPFGRMSSRSQDQGALCNLGLMSMTLADFGKLIAEETEKWAKVIRAANIKAE
jgi:hypothetical protein